MGLRLPEAFHGECLAGACLSVCEYRSVVAEENAEHSWLGGLGVYRNLSAIWAVNLIKCELMVRHEGRVPLDVSLSALLRDFGPEVLHQCAVLRVLTDISTRKEL